MNSAVSVRIILFVFFFFKIPFTGCGINPARSFGPALISHRWNGHWIYWAGPIFGGCISTISYQLFISVKNDDASNDNGPGHQSDEVEMNQMKHKTRTVFREISEISESTK